MTNNPQVCFLLYIFISELFILCSREDNSCWQSAHFNSLLQYSFKELESEFVLIDINIRYTPVPQLVLFTDPFSRDAQTILETSQNSNYWELEPLAQIILQDVGIGNCISLSDCQPRPKALFEQHPTPISRYALLWAMKFHCFGSIGRLVTSWWLR